MGLPANKHTARRKAAKEKKAKQAAVVAPTKLPAYKLLEKFDRNDAEIEINGEQVPEIIGAAMCTARVQSELLRGDRPSVHALTEATRNVKRLCHLCGFLHHIAKDLARQVKDAHEEKARNAALFAQAADRLAELRAELDATKMDLAEANGQPPLQPLEQSLSGSDKVLEEAKSGEHAHDKKPMPMPGDKPAVISNGQDETE